MPVRPAKTKYIGRSENCVVRTVSLDRATDQMLLELSDGRYSSTLRRLITMEYGRRQALAELQTRGGADE
jgi:hypothetical protein